MVEQLADSTPRLSVARIGLILYVMAAIAAVAASCAMFFGPEWIESLSGAAPDGGDGSLEVMMILAPLAAAIGLASAGCLVRRNAHS